MLSGADRRRQRRRRRRFVTRRQIAFGLSLGPAPNRFLVALAVLGLLSEAARERGLLCLIDDAQLSEDIPGYVAAPATALTYPWKTLISGHLGRLATRDDVLLHQQYMADLDASARTALDTVDPTPYFQKYGGNVWAGVKGYLNAVGEATAAPVIDKYTGVLAAADVFTPDVAFWLMESIRLDLGYGSQVHP